jgi:molecular chaperone GrpE (heat shock protein)
MTKVNGIECMEVIPEEFTSTLSSSGIEYVVPDLRSFNKKVAKVLNKAGERIRVR